MRTQIYCNDEYFNISFFGIDFTKVKRLLEYISVDSVSILRDESYQYIFDNHTLIDDFIDYASNINASIIIFDGMVESCLMDKELNTLMNRKILVDINLGENKTTILINRNNVAITKEEIKKIFSKPITKILSAKGLRK